MTGDLRAFAIGVGVFVVSYAAFLALGTWVRDVPPSVGWLILAAGYAAPLVSGFVCGYIAQKWQFLTLLALGIGAAVCLGGLNFAWGELGFPVDLGGSRNLPWVIGLALLTVVPLVVVGGAVGATLQRGTHA